MEGFEQLLLRHMGAVERFVKYKVSPVFDYAVTIGGKAFDTVRLVDIEEFKGLMLCEYYLDKEGRTILWRRFNSNNRAFDRYKKTWGELLPHNARLTLNGKTFVHWYDCITDRTLWR